MASMHDETLQFATFFEKYIETQIAVLQHNVAAAYNDAQRRIREVCLHLPYTEVTYARDIERTLTCRHELSALQHALFLLQRRYGRAVTEQIVAPAYVKYEQARPATRQIIDAFERQCTHDVEAMRAAAAESARQRAQSLIDRLCSAGSVNPLAPADCRAQATLFEQYAARVVAEALAPPPPEPQPEDDPEDMDEEEDADEPDDDDDDDDAYASESDLEFDPYALDTGDDSDDTQAAATETLAVMVSYEDALQAQLALLDANMTAAAERTAQDYATACAATVGDASACASDTRRLEKLLHDKLVAHQLAVATSAERLAHLAQAPTSVSSAQAAREIQRRIVAFNEVLAAQIAKFRTWLDLAHYAYARHAFRLCSAAASDRGALLDAAAQCRRQATRVQRHIDRVLGEMYGTAPPRRQPARPEDMPTFVQVQDRYPLRIARNLFPASFDPAKVLPVLFALIAADEGLRKSACVPDALGAQRPWPDADAFAAGAAPRFGAREAGRLDILEDPYGGRGVPAPLAWTAVSADVLLDRANTLRATYFLNGSADLPAALAACMRTHRFVLLLLSSRAERSPHQNALLVDTRDKTLERIEPNGTHSDMTVERLLDFYGLFVAERIVNRLGLGTYAYVPPRDVCPVLGPQALEERSRHGGGYCVAWSALILLARILNPDYATREVQERVVAGRAPKYLKDLIRAFMEFCDTVAREIGVAPEDPDASDKRNMSASPDAPFRAYA